MKTKYGIRQISTGILARINIQSQETCSDCGSSAFYELEFDEGKSKHDGPDIIWLLFDREDVEIVMKNFNESQHSCLTYHWRPEFKSNCEALDFEIVEVLSLAKVTTV